MRASRDAIFALLGLLAGTGLSTFWRVSVEVTRCALQPAAQPAAQQLAGSAGVALSLAALNADSDDDDDDEMIGPDGGWSESPPLDAAAFAALPIAGAALPPEQVAPTRAPLPRLTLVQKPSRASDARGFVGASTWGPRAPGGEQPAARASRLPDVSLWNLSHSFSAGELWTEQWTRRYRFGPIRLIDGSVWPPIFACELLRELLVPTAGADAFGGAAASARPTHGSDEGRERVQGRCGDSLRLRFVSSQALFAPLAVEERQGACGEFLVVFRPPALEGGARFAAELRLVHIDGEGLADPPHDLGLYVRDAQARDHGWALAACNASCQEAGPRFFNADLRVRGSLAVAAPPRAAPRSRAEQLPLCTHGESAGAFLLNRDPHFAAFEGEPWAWAPYDCSLRHFAPKELRECLLAIDERAGTPDRRRLPGVRFLGESTLVDALRAWLLQLRPEGSDWHWPRAFPTGDKQTGERNVMRELMMDASHKNQRGDLQPVAYAEQHGTRILLQQLRAWTKARFEEGLANLDPLGSSGATVLSQAHNDAMKVSFAEFQQNIFEITRLLRRYLASRPEQRFVWVTAPPRHYKEKHSPGHTECRSGRVRGDTSSCLSPSANQCSYPVDLDDGTRVVGGPLSPHYLCDSVRAEPYRWFAVLLFNTLDRVRRANRYAVSRLRKALGQRVAVVDYFQIVDALGAGYSVDGVHWSCETEDLVATRDGPDHCRSLGNAVLANVLANVVCNPRPTGDELAASAGDFEPVVAGVPAPRPRAPTKTAGATRSRLARDFP